MEIKTYYVKQLIESRHASVNNMNSKESLADGFTKPLDIQKFGKFRDEICVYPL